MSCSKWLLNKKSPLATVWVAAFRRVEALSRDQVASTDIVAFVGNASMVIRAMRDQSLFLFFFGWSFRVVFAGLRGVERGDGLSNFWFYIGAVGEVRGRVYQRL
jgi:hypothetical protein